MLLGLCIAFLRFVVFVDRDQNSQYSDLVNVNTTEVNCEGIEYTAFSIRMRSWNRATSRSS